MTSLQIVEPVDPNVEPASAIPRRVPQTRQSAPGSDFVVRANAAYGPVPPIFIIRGSAMTARHHLPGLNRRITPTRINNPLTRSVQS